MTLSLTLRPLARHAPPGPRIGRRAGPLLALLVLTGCADPAATCRARAEMRTIDDLLAETQANLDRGYVMVPASGPGMSMCVRGGNLGVGLSLCTDGASEKPVAVDAAAERRKIAGLKARKLQLTREMAADPACAL